MDIGVASVRNIFKIGWQRSLLWWILAISSVPIHLLYNSAIFKSIAANEYYAVRNPELYIRVIRSLLAFAQAVVNTEFLNGKPFWPAYQQTPYNFTQSFEGATDWKQTQTLFSLATKNGTTTMHPVVNLTNSECIAAYGTSFVSEYSSVLAITNAKGNLSNETMFYATEVTSVSFIEAGYPSYRWICMNNNTYPQYCDVGMVRKNAANWYIYNYKIEYCLAQVAEPYIALHKKHNCPNRH